MSADKRVKSVEEFIGKTFFDRVMNLAVMVVIFLGGIGLTLTLENWLSESNLRLVIGGFYENKQCGHCVDKEVGRNNGWRSSDSQP